MSKSTLFLMFFVNIVLSQNNIPSFLIDENLQRNANAIVQLDKCEIVVLSFDKVNVLKKRILTVLNKKGEKHVNALVFYDKSKTIKTLQAKVFDTSGNQLKKFKKKDFKDASAIDGVSIYNDDRVKYLDYVPVSYPYTIEFDLEYTTSFTVNLPPWYPVSGFNLSVQKSLYSINNQSKSEIRIQENNLKKYSVDKCGKYCFSVKNIPAIHYEQYSPSIVQFVPSVEAVLETFNMKGVKGNNRDWGSFGKWMYDNLLADTRELPIEVVNEINLLTKNAVTDIEKARIVYKYVQERTRYISVQVGIGGWKPSLAKDVHRLGYGDCKGLSNYTKALLDVIGVESYYTVIYGGSEIRDIKQQFSSLQGNHVILTMQSNNLEYFSLECTSQTVPFGYGANFTDNRIALAISPKGGEIIKTKSYKVTENKLLTNAVVHIDGKGGFNAKLKIDSKGNKYNRSEKIDHNSLKEQKKFYKDYWGDISNLSINSVTLIDDKEAIQFIEEISLRSESYIEKIGDLYLFSPNFFNKLTEVPLRYSNRKFPLEIDRGFEDIDEYVIHIPVEYELHKLLKPLLIKSEFGEYKISLENKEDNIFLYKRVFKIKSGKYSKEEYNDFRDFMLEVVKSDKSRIVIKKKGRR